MIEEKILKGNKLIAEFMGIDVKNSVELFIPEHERLVKFKTTNGTFVSAIFKFNELKYHSSWDWLTPVVEKISKELECKFYLYNRYLEEDTNRQDFLIFRMDNVETLWSETVEFIKWYNQNKK